MSDAEFVEQLARDHAAGQHVIPSYASCPGCLKARNAARAAAGEPLASLPTGPQRRGAELMRSQIMGRVQTYARIAVSLNELEHRRGQYFGPDGIARYQAEQRRLVARAVKVLGELEVLAAAVPPKPAA